MNKLDHSFKQKINFQPHANPHFASVRPMQAPELGDIHGAFGDSDSTDPVPTLSVDSDSLPASANPASAKSTVPKAMATMPSAAMPMRGQPAMATESMTADPPLKKNMHFDEAHWRVILPQRHYVLLDREFDRDYAPAYRFGHDQRHLHPHSRFEDVEHSLAVRWSQLKVQSRLSWQEAKDAVREAWLKVTGE
jgi:hypothetical protein